VTDGPKAPKEQEQPRDPDPGLTSALISVKSLVSIVMGLALTHTIITLVTDESAHAVTASSGSAKPPLLSLSQIEPQYALCAIAVVTAIVRFYHGNNQHLDLLYGEASRTRKGQGSSAGIGGNFIVIMLQSVFFALMSFYVNGSREIIVLFGVLLLVDIFWYVGNLTTTDTDATALNHQRKWMINNLVFLVVLGGLYYANNDGWAVTAAACAILINTLIDFRISWRFYFPNVPKPLVAEA